MRGERKMETALQGHRKWAMTDAGNKCRWEKKTLPSVSGNFPGLEKGISGSTLVLPTDLSPFPVQAESLTVTALRARHRVPAKPPLTCFRGQSVCPCSLLLLYPAAPPSPKFGVLPEGPSLPPLSPASSSSLDPLALEVTGGQQGLQICP